MLHLIDIFCSVVVIITAVARLNDMRKEQHEIRWWVRRAGMLIVTLAALFNIFSALYPAAFIEVVHTALLLGFTIAWVTTPNHPPWWKYITRGDNAGLNRRSTDGDDT